MLKLLCSILLLVAASPAAWAQTANSAQAASTNSNVIVADNRLTQLERDNLILQARSELEDKAYSRLEILSALFALLLTILVIAFGFRTEKSAARAAKGELADRQKELDEIMQAARAAAEAAEGASAAAVLAASTAQSHASTAADHLAQASESVEAIRQAASSAIAKPASPAESRKQDRIAEEAATTPRNQLSAEEFTALISKAEAAENWREAIDLAQGQRFLHSDDPKHVASSLFSEAYAHGRLKEHDAEITIYDRLIDLYNDNQDSYISQVVASSEFNRALTFLLKRDYPRAVQELDKIIAKYETKGDKFKDKVTNGLFWKAQALGNLGDVPAIISTLTTWKEKAGSLDCSKIKESAFFHSVQDDQRFKDFLSANGCLP